MNATTLSYELKITKGFFSLLKSEKRHTDDPTIALAVSRISGKLPIEHISPRVREAYRIAYPELSVMPEKEEAA